MCNTQKSLQTPVIPFCGVHGPVKPDSDRRLCLVISPEKMVWKQRLANKSHLHFPCLFLLYILQPLAYVFLSLPVPAIPCKFFREHFFADSGYIFGWLTAFLLVSLRACGRQVKFKIEFTTTNDNWPQNSALSSSSSTGIKNTHKEAGFLFFSLVHFKSLQVILDKRKLLLASKGQGKKKSRQIIWGRNWEVVYEE